MSERNHHKLVNFQAVLTDLFSEITNRTKSQTVHNILFDHPSARKLTNKRISNQDKFAAITEVVSYYIAYSFPSRTWNNRCPTLETLRSVISGRPCSSTTRDSMEHFFTMEFPSIHIEFQGPSQRKEPSETYIRNVIHKLNQAKQLYKSNRISESREIITGIISIAINDRPHFPDVIKIQILTLASGIEHHIGSAFQEHYYAKNAYRMSLRLNNAEKLTCTHAYTRYIFSIGMLLGINEMHKEWESIDPRTTEQIQIYDEWALPWIETAKFVIEDHPEKSKQLGDKFLSESNNVIFQNWIDIDIAISERSAIKLSQHFQTHFTTQKATATIEQQIAFQRAYNILLREHDALGMHENCHFLLENKNRIRRDLAL